MSLIRWSLELNNVERIQCITDATRWTSCRMYIEKKWDLRFPNQRRKIHVMSRTRRNIMEWAFLNSLWLFEFCRFFTVHFRGQATKVFQRFIGPPHAPWSSQPSQDVSDSEKISGLGQIKTLTARLKTKTLARSQPHHSHLERVEDTYRWVRCVKHQPLKMKTFSEIHFKSSVYTFFAHWYYTKKSNGTQPEVRWSPLATHTPPEKKGKNPFFRVGARKRQQSF